jgi:hypothetical protein
LAREDYYSFSGGHSAPWFEDATVQPAVLLKASTSSGSWCGNNLSLIVAPFGLSSNHSAKHPPLKE